MQEQPEFKFIKDLNTKEAQLSDEEVGSNDDNKENKPILFVTHCQYCEDADPDCKFCKGRGYQEEQ